MTAHIDPKAPPVGRVEFSVEDFVPEKLKVELTPDQPILQPGQVNSFAVPADFLYGAPASGLTVEADMRVTIDDQPFADFGKYSLRARRTSARSSSRPSSRSPRPIPTQAGKSRLEWGGDQVKDTALPLRAQLQARVFEPGGGRATRADKTVPMRTRDVYLGIRPTFEGRYAARRRRHRVRHRGRRRRRQAGRPAGSRVPHRAHRL